MAMEAAGQRVPGDFCQPTFFLTFQFDRTSLLAIVPILMGHLEQWAWMRGAGRHVQIFGLLANHGQR